jgi:hypothetical protein
LYDFKSIKYYLEDCVLKYKRVKLMPCLFPGIHFSGNHFSHFPMFCKHKKNWSKETEFGQWKKKKPSCQESVFLRKENTFLFSKRALTSNDCKGLIWWGQRLWQPMLFLYANVFFFIFMGQSKFRADESVYGQFMWTPLKTFLFCLNQLKLKLI